MDKNFFDDEIFNRDEYDHDIEVAQNFVATKEEVIKQFVDILIKDNNLDGMLEVLRGNLIVPAINFCSEYMEICSPMFQDRTYLDYEPYSFAFGKYYYDEIETISFSLKNNVMVLTSKDVKLTYKEKNITKCGLHNYGNMKIKFGVSENKLFVNNNRLLDDFNPSDDYEVYEF